VYNLTTSDLPSSKSKIRLPATVIENVTITISTRVKTILLVTSPTGKWVRSAKRSFRKKFLAKENHCLPNITLRLNLDNR
jgi:hypothetical protein